MLDITRQATTNNVIPIINFCLYRRYICICLPLILIIWLYLYIKLSANFKIIIIYLLKLESYRSERVFTRDTKISFKGTSIL